MVLRRPVELAVVFGNYTLPMSLCSFHKLSLSCFGSCQDDTRDVLVCDLYFLYYRGVWRRRHPHMNDTSRRIDADYI